MMKQNVENKSPQLNQTGKKKPSRSKRPGYKEKIQAEQKRLKDLEASVRSQVAAEERAHKIVEKLVLEDEISEEFLLQSGNFITTSHYADVVEERMIAQKCGYPLCKNHLSKIPSQKYKISLQTNRVYDITERKCFCSNFCFKASKYFGSQISDSPVWTRIGESLKVFSLLESEDSSGGTGAGNVLLGEDEEQENVSDGNGGECLEDSDQDDIPSINTEDQSEGSKFYENKLTDDNQDLKKDNNSENLNPGYSVCDIDGSKTARSWKNEDNKESSAENRTFSSEKVGRHVVRNDSHHRRETIIQSVQAVFQEWCTHSTLEYLGLSDDKTMTETRSPDEGERDSDIARAARFFQPVVNVKKDYDSDSDTEKTSSKLSHEDITIKERYNKESVCVLPPIDSKSQTTIRRRIVLDKLFRTLPDLLSEIKLTVGEVSHDLTQLVRTFSFSNKNVALKPLQWNILALALIVILQRKNSLVLQAMESWSNEFDSLLGRQELARHDIDQVLSFLPSFTPQYSEKYESLEKGNISATLHTQPKVVPEERKDFGDMEELD